MAERAANRMVRFADKGFVSDNSRGELRVRDAAPEIPTERNRKISHAVNRALCAMRNKIERFCSQLNRSRSVAAEYDLSADSFLGFANLASIKLWI